MFNELHKQNEELSEEIQTKDQDITRLQTTNENLTKEKESLIEKIQEEQKRWAQWGEELQRKYEDEFEILRATITEGRQLFQQLEEQNKVLQKENDKLRFNEEPEKENYEEEIYKLTKQIEGQQEEISRLEKLIEEKETIKEEMEIAEEIAEINELTCNKNQEQKFEGPKKRTIKEKVYNISKKFKVFK